jgi:hypothetical protein
MTFSHSTNRILAISFSLFVLTSAIGTPAFLPDQQGPVEEGEAVAPALIAVGAAAVTGAAAMGTLYEYGILGGDSDDGQTSSSVDDVIAKNKEYTRADRYKNALEKNVSLNQLNHEWDDRIRVFNNTVDNSEDAAFGAARAAAIEAMNNNESKSQAAADANQAIDEYYANQQRNLIRTVDLYEYRLEHIHAAWRGHGLVDTQNYTHGVVGRAGGAANLHRNETVTLYDGSTETYNFTLYSVQKDTDEDVLFIFNNSNVSHGNPVLNTQDYQTVWQNIDTHRQSVRTDSDAWIDAVYNDYSNRSPGNKFQPKDPTVYQHLNTNTTGRGRLLTSLVGTGNPAELNKSVELTINGTTYECHALTAAKTHTLSTGDDRTFNNTYCLTGSGSIYLDGQNATVGTITAENGTEVDTLTLEPEFEASLVRNTSNLERYESELSDARNETNELLSELQSMSGGGGILGNLSGTKLVVLLLVGAVVVVYALGGNNPRRRRR